MTNENVNYKGFLSKIAEDTKTEDPIEQKNARGHDGAAGAKRFMPVSGGCRRNRASIRCWP